MDDRRCLDAAIKIGEAHAVSAIKYALRVRRLRRAMYDAIRWLRTGRPDRARRTLEEAIDED